MAKLNVQVGNLWYLALSVLNASSDCVYVRFQFVLASGQGLRVCANDSAAVA